MKRVYINEAVCMGCRLCEVYCRIEHSPTKDLIKAFRGEPPQPLLQVEKREPISFAVQCRHCPEPYCVYACLTGALEKQLDGVVSVDKDKCIGCWTCILACPWGVIRREARERKIVKCDLCQGEAMPACVSHCPNEALIYADADSMEVRGKQ
jgi:carbon-monoxide dehydrogenase iron sulfur subunit